MGLKTGRIYKVIDLSETTGNRTAYAVSPDTEGAYWYDSLAIAKDEHGDLPVVEVDRDYFDALRED
jgi:hypothetical protein